MFIDRYHLEQFWKKSWIVDLLLFLLILSLMFLTYIINHSAANFDFNNFILNLITEIVGVWLSVRIIDNLLKKRQRLETVRKDLLGNLRFIHDYTSDHYPHLKEKHLEEIKKENKWFNSRWEKRKGVLKSKEINLAREIISLNYDIERLVANVVVVDNIRDSMTFEEANKLEEERLKVVKLTLTELESKIDNLVIIYWDTNDPDKI